MNLEGSGSNKGAELKMKKGESAGGSKISNLPSSVSGEHKFEFVHALAFTVNKLCCECGFIMRE